MQCGSRRTLLGERIHVHTLGISPHEGLEFLIMSTPMTKASGQRMSSADRVDVAHRYRKGLRAYEEAIASGGFEVSSLRTEHQFECLHDWSLFHSLGEVEDWFRSQRDSCSMTVSDIPLNAAIGWTLDPLTGNISHVSEDFFTVHAIRVADTSMREVGSKGWDQPILEQVGYDGGLLGLLRKRFDGIPHYLLEAKAEPGNYELVQMSPTLQATFSNLRRSHGGRRPAFADLFEDAESVGGTVLYRQWLSEDGGRLHKKRNLGMLVEVPDGHTVPVAEGFILVSMYQNKAMLLQNAWVNPHVRGIIAHL
jgi:oxidase EvaA